MTKAQAQEDRAARRVPDARLPEPRQIDNRHIVIAVCTAQRPRMLESCLQSLVVQQPSAGWSHTFLVVENDPEPKSRAVVESVAQASGKDIHYAQQPVRGIPFVRNKAVEEILKLDAGWIIFLDDDEQAAPGWLAALTDAADYYDGQVFHGAVEFTFPETGAEWAKLTMQSKVRQTGERQKTAYTNNVLFSTELVRESGLNMRFDEGMMSNGGDDEEFFSQAFARGCRIYHVAEAIVTEEVPPARCSYWRIMQRIFRGPFSGYYIEHKRNGRAAALKKSFRRGVQYLLKTLVALLLLPFALLFMPQKRYETLFALGEKACLCAGYLLAFTPLMPQPYKQIDGN